MEMVVDSGYLARFLSDGAGQSRQEDGSVPVGSTLPWFLQSGGHSYERFGRDDGPVSWQDHGPSDWGGIPDLGLSKGCDTGWEHHGSDLVLDRPAHHLVCGYDEYWIDAEWMLVVRHQRNPDPLSYDTDVEAVTELRFGVPPAELFELPADACISADFRARDCVPLATGSPSPAVSGSGPTLAWARVDLDGVSNVAWLGDRFVASDDDGVSASTDGVTWESLDATDPDAGYGQVLRGSKTIATWGDGIVGWDAAAVRTVQAPGPPLTKSDFDGAVGAVGIGPAGIVAQVHSGIDVDAFVTTFLGSDWVGQIKEFEFADGVLHIATDDGRSADIVMADHGLGPGDVADRGYGWYSADGVDWSVIPDFPSSVTDIVGVADGMIARGESMWHSPDGLTWNEIGPDTEGDMLGWHEGALLADSSGRMNLWTAAGARPLPMTAVLRSASGRSHAAVDTGSLGLVSIGTSDVLYTPDGSDWRVEAMPEAMYASGGGGQAPVIAVGDDSALALLWSGGESPVPSLWLGTPES